MQRIDEQPPFLVQAFSFTLVQVLPPQALDDRRFPRYQPLVRCIRQRRPPLHLALNGSPLHLQRLLAQRRFPFFAGDALLELITVAAAVPLVPGYYRSNKTDLRRRLVIEEHRCPVIRDLPACPERDLDLMPEPGQDLPQRPVFLRQGDVHVQARIMCQRITRRFRGPRCDSQNER